MTTIHASDIRPGDVVETIPSIASGRTTATRITVDAVKPYRVNGDVFYDVHGIETPNGGGTTVTNMSNEYRLVAMFH